MRNNSSGFTLIELLVTVAIVGILASLGIAQFQKFKERANDSQAISQALAVRNALFAYRTANRILPTAVTIMPNGTVTGGVLSEVFPGFTHQIGVKVRYTTNSIETGHCKGSRTSHAGYSQYVGPYACYIDSGLGCRKSNATPQYLGVLYGGASC